MTCLFCSNILVEIISSNFLHGSKCIRGIKSPSLGLGVSWSLPFMMVEDATSYMLGLYRPVLPSTVAFGYLKLLFQLKN